jgi:hypothetical protein
MTEDLVVNYLNLLRRDITTVEPVGFVSHYNLLFFSLCWGRMRLWLNQLI